MFLDFVREHYYRWSEELKELNDRTMRLALTDLRLPHKWYPAARDLPTGRKIILHIGPTNRFSILHIAFLLTADCKWEI